METATVSNSNSYMPQNIANATIRLAIVKARKSPLIEYMQKSIKVDVDIKDVRRRLAKIKSSMAAEMIGKQGLKGYEILFIDTSALVKRYHSEKEPRLWIGFFLKRIKQ